MTSKEDIIRMVREAGFEYSGKELTWESVICTEELERFAALVRADEREKVAAWMMAQGYATGHGDTIEDLLKELEWQIRESEREACAKLCAELHPGLSSQRVAEAIRARGQA